MVKKLYKVEEVRAIADALRLKKDGSVKTYTTRQMGDGVLLTPFCNIPNYHYAEAGRVVRKILDLKEKYPKHIVFGTISDNHINTAKASTMESVRHAVFALENVGAMAQCDFIANLGDNIEGNTGIDGTDHPVGFNNMVYMERISKYALTSRKAYNLVGNHDKSNNTEKLFEFIGAYNNFQNHGNTQMRGYGYDDYKDQKVRVICLNTCDYYNAQGGNGMSYEQKEWFMKALDVSEKEESEKWLIVVLSHIPLDFFAPPDSDGNYRGGDYNKGTDLKAILSAYNNGGTVNIACNYAYAKAQHELGSEADAWGAYEGKTITYDYDGRNSAKVVNIHGHIHNNKYGQLKFIDNPDNPVELNMIRIATANSAGEPDEAKYTAYGEYDITREDASKIEKVANSKKDTSATFYFIDLQNQVIYSIGYGADIDRTIPIDTTKPTYTITYNLENCTSSETTTTVVEGSEYTTIIKANEGCILTDDVSIIMNGVDITNNGNSDETPVYDYDNGVINIESVSGNLVITIKAVDNYVPAWDISKRDSYTNEKSRQDFSTENMSRHYYYLGTASDKEGMKYFKPEFLTQHDIDDNDIHFTSTEQNVGIGLPFLNMQGSYQFSGNVKVNDYSGGSSRRLGIIYVDYFDSEGNRIEYEELKTEYTTETSSSFEFDITVPENTTWTIITPCAQKADDNVSYTNLTLTKV